MRPDRDYLRGLRTGADLRWRSRHTEKRVRAGRGGDLITRRYLAGIFSTPGIYLVAAALHAMTAVLGVAQLVVRGQAVTQPIAPIVDLLLIVALPVIATRPLTEDARTSATELLRAEGVTPTRQAVAAWAASTLASVVLIAPMVLWWFLLSAFADPAAGPAITAVAGFVALAAVVCGLSVAASAFARQQAIPLGVGILTGLALWFAYSGPDPIPGRDLFAALSLSERMRGFASGVIDFSDVGMMLLAVVISLTVAAAALRLQARAGGARSRTRASMTAVLVLVFIVGALLVDGVGPVLDLTPDGSATLSSGTRDVLDRLNAPTELLAAFAVDDPGRSETATLLDRYSRQSQRVHWRFVDPSRDAAAIEASLDAGSVAVKVKGGELQVAQYPNELEITSAIGRAVSGNQSTWCTPPVSGGRTTIDGPGSYTRFVAALDRAGYSRSPYPDCDVVILADPVAAPQGLPEGASVLLATEPETPETVSDVLASYGLRLLPGYVVEGGPNAAAGDPLTMLISKFTASGPTDGLGPVVLAGAAGVEVIRGAGSSVSAALAATSTEASYLESDLGDGSFDPAADTGGPIGLIATADRSRVVQGEVERVRAFVITDADAFSDALWDQAANARLALRAMDWLTAQEFLSDAASNFPTLRPLSLTSARRLTMLWVLGGVTPLLFLLAGAAVWVLRRSL